MIRMEYTPLSGGLDISSSALNVKPGKLMECLNFEQVFGRQGYFRINGYERFDGSPQPHLATYSLLDYDNMVAAINAGDIIAGASATAKVVSVVAASASAGTLVLDSVSGAFVDNEAITVSAATKANVNGVIRSGSISEEDNVTYLQATIAQRRDAIQVVPGEGAILGVAVFDGVVYAVRNIAGGASATLWKSSGSGWTSVRTGLYPGGLYRFTVANFSGSTTTRSLFGVNGRGRMFRLNASGFAYAGVVFGSESLSTTSNTIGTGAKTFTLSTTARSYLTGDSLTIWSTANAGNRMIGTVTSYNAGTNALVMDITSVVGSGTFTDWEMCRSSFTDRPFDVVDHKDHMWLAYVGGQLQTSNIGDPMIYTTSAALFGVGEEITGLTSLKGGVLGVFCKNKIDLIAGSSLTDWQMESNSSNTGAVFGTVQENTGNAFFLDGKGITTLQGSQNFGAFDAAIASRSIKRYLDSVAGLTVASRVVKSKYQYRLYFSNGDVLSGAIMNPTSVIQPDDVAFLRAKYDHVPTCVASGDVDGEEAHFFGTSSGYVMREDVGTSFDGGIIPSVLRLHYLHFKSPSVKKRFRKLVLEMDASAPVTLRFRQLFDYDDGYYRYSPTQQVDLSVGGGSWGSADWDEFRWSLPSISQAEAHIDGMGRNMGLLVFSESATDAPYAIQGILTHFSPMGIAR